MTWHDKLQRLVWNIGEFFRQPDTKFAIKAGLGSALLASPAFFPSTRPIFTKYQGQWALVSFMVVLSPTVGQSNHMSLHRILGTILGACAAVGIYKLFPDNNVVLPLFGALFSIPCFRYIVGKPQLASSGRFVLLTYNLTALYSYNLRKTDVEVEQIAYQRTVSVIVGVVWATVLNQLVWPFEARRQLALGVSDVLFKLAWLYQRLVLSYSRDPSQLRRRRRSRRTHEDEQDDESFYDSGDEDVGDDDDEMEDEEAALLGTFASRHGDEFQAIELHLQVSLIKLEGFLHRPNTNHGSRDHFRLLRTKPCSAVVRTSSTSFTACDVSPHVKIGTDTYDVTLSSPSTRNDEKWWATFYCSSTPLDRHSTSSPPSHPTSHPPTNVEYDYWTGFESCQW